MWFQSVFVLCAVFGLMSQFVMVECEDYGQATLNYNGHTKKLSEHLVAMLEHFKQPDPVGLPWIDIPHVYRLPAMNKSSVSGSISFINNTIYGLDKFRIKTVDVKFPGSSMLKIHIGLAIDTLHLLGNVTLPSDEATTERYTVAGKGLNIEATTTLRVNYADHLVVDDFTLTSFSFYNINTDLKNEGLAGTILKEMLNVNRNLLIDIFKPYVFKQVHSKVVNAKLIGVRFPNIESPLDAAINAAKRKVNYMSLDPMYFEDSYIETSEASAKLWSGRFVGLSSIHKIGQFNLKMENNMITTEFKVGLRKLEGITHWTIYKFFDFDGDSSLSLDYTTISVKVSLPLDTRRKPFIEYFDIDVAEIRYIQNGAFIFSSLEDSIRGLATKIRHSIIQAITEFFIYEAQYELNKINVENIIKTRLLPKLIELERMGLKILF